MDKLELLVSDGRVFCPRRKRDVEVDDCLSCERLDHVRRWRSDIIAVTCQRPWGSVTLADELRLIRWPES